jgi:uncharacterized membrane protein YedE/YeeE
MGGGVLVNLVLHRWITRRRSRPLLAEHFSIPTRGDIDRRLLVGAVLFGAGWALAGYCPGPGIVSLADGSVAPFVFFGFMIVGVLLEKRVSRRRST